MILIIIIFTTLLYIFYKWATLNNNFFSVRNIPYDKPFPLLGSFVGVYFRTDSLADALHKCYNENKEYSIFGSFQGREPLIVVKDPELIKKIMVKDFDHFLNHRSLMDPEVEPLITNSVFSLKNQKWKDMRSTLSPAFTGSKMRSMFQLVRQCCDDASSVVLEKTKCNPNGFTLDMQDYFTRYTNDVIASTAFGLNINSVLGINSEFYDMGKKATSLGAFILLKMMLLINFKSMSKLLKITLFNKKVTGYFKRIVLDTIKYRVENNIHRPDMIDMLIEARSSKEKSHNREWTDDEIVAQSFLFFFAGFDTTASAMCFAAHELMENPECQEKLYNEIKEIDHNLNGNPITYETLSDMKYMDMVMSETLRKWPLNITTDRVCTKPYTLKSDNQKINLNVGDIVMIPIYAMQRDSKYFPNPEKFDPERFNDENKANIDPFVYCPFGAGPRICIGMRLALMEAKCILFYLLKSFKFEKSEKTIIPIEIRRGEFQLKPKGGFWLKLVPRNQ